MKPGFSSDALRHCTVALVIVSVVLLAVGLFSIVCQPVQTFGGRLVRCANDSLVQLSERGSE